MAWCDDKNEHLFRKDKHIETDIVSLSRA